jgi:hypothetical protein
MVVHPVSSRQHPHTAPILGRMQARIHAWEATADDKALFLRCYLMMTSNTLATIQRRAFRDPAWVDRLLHRFADYYFVALEAYEQEPAAAPAVWRQAHAAARDPAITGLQKLLLGINAHINYDLVLTLVDLLRPEWQALSEPQRAARYADHCAVNEVIGRTIDAVQDHVVEPAMPFMEVVDTLLGPLDEFLISRLIARWRETVWTHAAGLLATDDAQEQARRLRAVEAETLQTAALICRRAAIRHTRAAY